MASMMAIMISNKGVSITRVLSPGVTTKVFVSEAYNADYAKSANNAKNEQEFAFDLDTVLGATYLRFVNEKYKVDVVKSNLGW